MLIDIFFFTTFENSRITSCCGKSCRRGQVGDTIMAQGIMDRLIQRSLLLQLKQSILYHLHSKKSSLRSYHRY